MQILSTITKRQFNSIMEMSPKEIIEKIKQSGLTGRGGALFPTGIKWEMARAIKSERFLVCNADEGEPGTFKDKFIIVNNLKTLLQGIAIGGHALNAKCFIYLRGEYSYLRKKIERSIKKLGFDIEVVTGAGAYICGEETALLESIEGKRGIPRLKPPYPTVEGLWKKSTCINNVETLTNVPLLLAKKNWNRRLRLFSVSGSVKKPSIYELPLGTRLEDIIKSTKPGKVKAVCAGYSGGVIPFERFKNMEVDYKTLSDNSFILGSCAMIVIGKMDIVKIVKNIAEFFVHESCGKCVPCREGGFRILEIINKIDSGRGREKDLRELIDLASYLDISFCGLGKAYGLTIKSAVKNFKKEFDEKCR